MRRGMRRPPIPGVRLLPAVCFLLSAAASGGAAELTREEKDAVLERVGELRSEKPGASGAAETWLIRSGGKSVPYLCELLGSAREDLPTGDVVKVLGEIGDQRAVKSLVPLTSAGQPLMTRRLATDALARIGGSDVVERLTKLLLDKQRLVSLAAYRGLTRLAHDKSSETPLGPEIAGAVLWEFAEAEGHVRLWMIGLLGETRDERSAPQLLELVASGPEELRLPSLKALVRIGSGEAAVKLLELLLDKDPRVRKEAASAIGAARLDDEQRREVVTFLLELLGAGNAQDPKALRSLATGLLARVTGEGEGRSVYKWRQWGVKNEFGDPGAPVPPEEYVPAKPAERTAVAAVEESFWTSRSFIIAVSGVALLLTLVLLRQLNVGRAARKIEATRRKVRRRMSDL